MKYQQEYRNKHAVVGLSKAIFEAAQGNWTLMEVCGGQTHTILKYGIDQLLPPNLSIIHGPGCPVCVTGIDRIDAAQQLASIPQVILCSFGDMLRVPGSKADLFSVKAQGADVRIVYSIQDALAIAKDNPSREVVFFAVGFETTAPTTAHAVYLAQAQGIHNFSLLVSHVLVPPAIDALLSAPGHRKIDGFLAAGHVCSIMGYHEYEALSAKYQVPIVVTGFEPTDLLEGFLSCVRQLEQGQAKVENQYARVVNRAGNREAQRLLNTVFEADTQQWRGLGPIAHGGLKLTPNYAAFDALKRFGVTLNQNDESSDCRSGAVLSGEIKPTECPNFGKKCTPLTPLGAPMVSSEGACAAYHQFRLHEPKTNKLSSADG